MKRSLDILVAGALLILTLPFWAVAAVAIKTQDRGPVFFRQTRVGRGQREFGLLKFRTMVTDAETLGGYQTVDGDPRITRVGRWLRRSSIDELPQLWNVLRGEMSLVGPRPDTPAQAAMAAALLLALASVTPAQAAGYTPDQWALRCSVRPGLTGLAQVARKTGKADRSRLELDLEYIRRQSLWRDISILGQTVLVVLRLVNH